MIQPGIYQHYKGNKYEVLGVAMHSETREEFVLYKAVDVEGHHWVRPKSMFLEEVTVDGVSKPRFTYISTE